MSYSFFPPKGFIHDVFQINLQTLASRQVCCALIFLYKMLQIKVYLNHLNFFLSRLESRDRYFFYTQIHNTNMM